MRDHRRTRPIETRFVQIGARIVDADGFGAMTMHDGAQDTVGDVLGASHWPAEQGKRPIGGWSYAWPVTTVTETVQSGSGPGGGGFGQWKFPPSSQFQAGDKSAGGSDAGGAGSAPPTAYRPIGGAGYEPDQRFAAVQPAAPSDWPKFPRGWRGVGLCTTQEYEQTNLFMPADPRLIAVHAAGDPLMGSMVCDLDSSFGVAENRRARLQSMMWIIRNWGPAPNSIGWNINLSQQGDHLGGLVVDFPSSPGAGTINTPGGKDIPERTINTLDVRP